MLPNLPAAPDGVGVAPAIFVAGVPPSQDNPTGDKRVPSGPGATRAGC